MAQPQGWEPKKKGKKKSCSLVGMPPSRATGWWVRSKPGLVFPRGMNLPQLQC